MGRNRIAAFAALAVMVAGCSPGDPFALLNCRFRVENTEDFHVCGICLDRLESLSVSQAAKVAAAWTSGTCPVDFTLNVGIFNPNDGTSSSGAVSLTLTGFDWDLYVDADPKAGFDTTWVASGSLGRPLEVPGGGETVILPLEISFDAVTFFKDMGVLKFVGLALAVGGIDSDIRDSDHLGRLLIRGVPTITGPFGLVIEPGELYIGLDWVE